MKVLFLRRGGLGDTLVTAAALRALRRHHAGAALHFAGVAEFAAVLAAHGVVDRVHSSEDLALWSPARARARLSAFDRVYGDEPGLAFAVLAPNALRPGAPCGLQLAQQLGLAPNWPADALLAAPRPIAPGAAIVLAPGSGARAKCWPAARWLELAARLSPGAPLAVLVGPAERERDDPRGWAWPSPVTFALPADAVALARALGDAAAFVGNDSGPSHLAAMLGVPTVALFGPSDATIWGPVGPRVSVLAGEGGDLGAIPVAAVVAALAATRALAP